MSTADGRSADTALAPRAERELLSSATRRRSVKPASKRWQPPEGLAPEDVQAVIAAAACERDRLLLTTLWATGARISEVRARLHTEYLTLSDDEAQHLMQDVPD